MAEPQRMNLMQLTPEAYRHLVDLEQTIASHIEPKLYHLIKLRASQINGCAFCIAMHTDEALRDGEKPERLTLLDAWAESDLFSEKDQAALAWVEEVTLIADHGAATREAFDKLADYFSEQEIGWLTLGVMQINSWNRLAIASRSQYRRARSPVHEPAAKHEAETA
jgi:AhpD family alkylhydroperoxidase